MPGQRDHAQVRAHDVLALRYTVRALRVCLPQEDSAFFVCRWQVRQDSGASRPELHGRAQIRLLRAKCECERSFGRSEAVCFVRVLRGAYHL
jgi:hypothetical protein